MAGFNDVVANQLKLNQGLFEQFISDFSDDDAKFMPAEDSPHLNWILCHLAASEDQIVSKISGQPQALSPKLHETYKGGSKCIPEDGMTRTEAWQLFTKTHAATIAFIRDLDERQLSEPTPGTPNPMFKTIGDYVALLGAHGYWHFGQLTVIRRMLGKPAKFGA
jgi:uncharacterized damage-inducible protein DinB